jgi:hypothetical protein
MSGLEGLLEGKVLVNRYRIEQVIGRGGFAAVYSAADERLGRTVAVKVITLAAPDTATHEQLRERFQREARSAAGLPQHPNVVTVYDFGTDPETGIDFLVMELLRGEDLASRLSREPRLPLEVALGILREAVEGIAVGHRAGVVHRDVKPGNVFLAEPLTDEPFRVCVLDFGIARVIADEGTAHRLTQQGSTPLSPAYASPEQLAGEIDLTCASDVFSLGVLAYQLLTGERPFGTERRRGAGGWDVTPLRDRNPDVPQAVADVVHRALAYDPEARFEDAGAMAAALDAAAGTSASAPAAAGLDDHTRVAPAAVAAAGAAGLAGASAARHDEDDRTLIARPTAAAAAPVPAPAAAPPAPRPSPEPVAVPARKRSMAPVALFVALLLAGGAGAAVWLGRGGETKDVDRNAPADTASSAPTSVPAGSAPVPSEGDVPVSVSPPSGTTYTPPTTPPAGSPTDPGGTFTSPGAPPQPASPSAPAAGGVPVSPSPSSPAPSPSAPAAPSPAAPRPAAPPAGQPTPPSQPAPPPAQQPVPPVQPAPPPDTAHMNPVPLPAPRDTLRLPPPPQPIPPTVPPPDTTGE